MDEHGSYVAYMLRLWRVGDNDGPAWRASLESPDTAERLTFPNLESLFSFLSDKTLQLAAPGQLTQPVHDHHTEEADNPPPYQDGTVVNRDLVSPQENRR